MSNKSLVVSYFVLLAVLFLLFLTNQYSLTKMGSEISGISIALIGIIIIQSIYIVNIQIRKNGVEHQNSTSQHKHESLSSNIDSMPRLNSIETKNLFQELSENVPGLIYQFKFYNDGTSNFTYLSSAVESLYEVTIQEGLDDKNNIFKKVLDVDYANFFNSIVESKNNLTPWMHEFRVSLPQKGIRWLKGESNPTKFDDCIVWNGFIRDITAQKLLETELSLSEQLFRGVFTSSAIGIALVNPDGTWAKVNDSLCDFLGYTHEELTNNPFSNITHPDDIEIGRKNMQDLANGQLQNLHYEKRYIHKNGSVVWALLSGSVVRDDAGKLLYLVAQIKNITERKVAEEKLRYSISNLQSILDASTHVAIIGTDLRGKINLFNKGAENLLGYKPEEIIGIHTPAIYHLRSELESKRIELSTKYNRKVSIKEVFIDKAINDNYDIQEWTYVRKNRSTFPVQITITAIRNAEHEITGYLGVATDISQLKEKEKELKDLVLVTGEQNKRLVNFAHIVSHNLRSHSGNFSLLLGIYNNETNEAERKEILSLLKKASVQLTETVLNLNEVVVIATNVNEKKELHNLYKEIEKVRINLAGVLLEKKVEMINLVKPEIEIKFVTAYLESILLNFVTNAIKYSSNERESFVKLSTYKDDHYTVLVVEDNGLGIDLKMHEHKLFGMYKTFHGNKDARGIGLFITKNQIDAMQGKIEVESELNVGTKFKIFFNENIV